MVQSYAWVFIDGRFFPTSMMTLRREAAFWVSFVVKMVVVVVIVVVCVLSIAGDDGKGGIVLVLIKI